MHSIGLPNNGRIKITHNESLCDINNQKVSAKVLRIGLKYLKLQELLAYRAPRFSIVHIENSDLHKNYPRGKISI